MSRKQLILLCVCLVAVFGDQCDPGYFRSGGQCSLCPFSCQSCWALNHCSRCKPGYYGEDCSIECPYYCKDCNKNTGRCTTSCPAGSYSSGNNSCTPCPSNCKDCNRTYCFDCKVGFTGQECQDQCINCLPGTGCNRDGYCLSGCTDNFSGKDCNISCPSRCLSCERLDADLCITCAVGSYGQSCQSHCNMACRERECNKRDGSCLFGCKAGFSGQFCDLQPSTLGTTLIGSLVGIIVLVMGTCTVYIVYCNRKYSKSPGYHPDDVTQEPPVEQEMHLIPVINQENYQIQAGTSEDPEYEYVHPVIGREDQPSLRRKSGDQSVVKWKLVEFIQSKTDEQYREEFKYICDRSRAHKENQIVTDRDYLHAPLNSVDGFEKRKAYIVCIAPTENTKDAFWKMVWNERCEKIILLCKEPKITETQAYWLEKEHICGDINVTTNGDLAFETHFIEDIELKKQNEVRNVAHLHLRSGLKEGTEEEALSLVKLRNDANMEPKKDVPYIICSSDNMSLCGMYIAFDTMVDELEKANHIDIVRHVSHLFRQRPDLQLTVEEYHFLHMALVSFVTTKVWKRKSSSRQNAGATNVEVHQHL